MEHSTRIHEIYIASMASLLPQMHDMKWGLDTIHVFTQRMVKWALLASSDVSKPEDWADFGTIVYVRTLIGNGLQGRLNDGTWDETNWANEWSRVTYDRHDCNTSDFHHYKISVRSQTDKTNHTHDTSSNITRISSTSSFHRNFVSSNEPQQNEAKSQSFSQAMAKIESIKRVQHRYYIANA